MSEPKWEPCPVCGEDWSPETDPCLARLARRVKRLEGALEEYGGHTGGCPGGMSFSLCNCGWSEARAALAEEAE